MESESTLEVLRNRVSRFSGDVKNSAYGLVFQHTSRCFDTVVKNAFSFCIYT